MADDVRGLEIRIRNLEDGMHPVELRMPAEILELPSFSKEVEVTGSLRKEDNRLTLSLTSRAEGHFECVRCNDPFDRVIEARSELLFVPPHLYSEEIENEDVHPFDPFASHSIDITPDIRDAVGLAVPMRMYCRKNCQGLCPVCGVNHNYQDCDCEVPVAGGVWSELEELREQLRKRESGEGS